MKWLLLFSLLSFPAFADPLQETRYCFPIVRDADGTIHRSQTVLTAFKKVHPCPAPVGTKCPGWYMDHVIPLACGGCDSVNNLQWLPEQLWRAKSLWERQIYAEGGGFCNGN